MTSVLPEKRLFSDVAKTFWEPSPSTGWVPHHCGETHFRQFGKNDILNDKIVPKDHRLTCLWNNTSKRLY